MSNQCHVEVSGDSSADKDTVAVFALSKLLKSLDEDCCRKWLFDLLRPGKLAKICPFCGYELSNKVQHTFSQLKTVSCKSCKRQYNATTDTPFHRTKLTPSEFFLLGALSQLGVDPHVINQTIGRTINTTRFWADRLRCLDVSDCAASTSPGKG